jgi:hypothetical protein
MSNLRRGLVTGRFESDVPYLLRDDFTDADNTVLTSHAIAPTNRLSASWANVFGSFKITSNRAAIATQSASTRSCTVVDTGRTTYSVRCKLYRTAGSVGMISKVTNEQNFIATVHTGTNVITQIRIADVATNTTVATAYVDGAELQVDVGNGTLDIYYNGARVGTQISFGAPFANLTTAGIYQSNGGGTWDQFMIYPF